MEKPKISVVTPSYNQSDFLERNLSSVCSQSYSNVEHIIVDGGSTDGTIDILRDYEDCYDLKWVSEPDNGQTDALNKGLEMATGDWIGWQNSDDFYLPGSFDHVVSTVAEYPEADVVYGDLLIVNGEGEEVARQFMTRPSKFLQRYWSLFASNQSLFVRADVFDSIAPLSEELFYTMDAELTWELLTGGYDLVHVRECLGAFRIQDEAKTFGDVTASQREELDAIYDHPWYEDVLPRSLLENAAKVGKLCLLLSEGHSEALVYNFKRRFSS